LSPLEFRPISADLAIDLFEALKAARRLQLQPALSAAVHDVGVLAIDAELQRLVPVTALNHVAALGLRGERVFPVPAIIAHAPPLIGYYRMLLGLSRKEFSQPNRLGYGPWLTAEESGTLPPRLTAVLDQFCAALIAPLADLVQAMNVFDDRDLSDLALLTLGPTLQGGRNNLIGSRAALQVFEAIRALVAPWITFERGSVIRFATPTGRTFEVVASSDPDLRIDEGEGTETWPLVAIEIKGGGDASNAHNRAGEAEKSQIKAVGMGYGHRWTVIRMQGVNRQRIREETPSSTEVFEASEVIAQAGPDWDTFRQQLGALIGESLAGGITYPTAKPPRRRLVREEPLDDDQLPT
jgi:hypothetical protein